MKAVIAVLLLGVTLCGLSVVGVRAQGAAVTGQFVDEWRDLPYSGSPVSRFGHSFETVRFDAFSGFFPAFDIVVSSFFMSFGCDGVVLSTSRCRARLTHLPLLALLPIGRQHHRLTPTCFSLAVSATTR